MEFIPTNGGNYGFRIYNPGIGRFLSVDPLTRDYPWYTPYQFAGNGPIANIDLDGLEPVSSVDYDSQDDNFTFNLQGVNVVTRRGTGENVDAYWDGGIELSGNRLTYTQFRLRLDAHKAQETILERPEALDSKSDLQGGYVIYGINPGGSIIEGAKGDNTTSVMEFPYFPSNYHSSVGKALGFVIDVWSLAHDETLFSSEWINDRNRFTWQDQIPDTKWSKTRVSPTRDTMWLIQMSPYTTPDTSIYVGKKSKGWLKFKYKTEKIEDDNK